MQIPVDWAQLEHPEGHSDVQSAPHSPTLQDVQYEAVEHVEQPAAQDCEQLVP